MTLYGQIFAGYGAGCSDLMTMKNAINKRFGQQAAKIRAGGSYMTIIMSEDEAPLIMQVVKSFGGKMNIDSH